MRYSILWFIVASILSFATGFYSLFKLSSFQFLMWLFLGIVFFGAGRILEKRKCISEEYDLIDIWD